MKQIFYFLWALVLIFTACTSYLYNDSDVKIVYSDSEFLDSQEASYVALKFADDYLQRTKSLNHFVQDVFPLLTDNNSVLAYAVNFVNGGYTIISGTKKYYPVIAYSSEGSLSKQILDECHNFNCLMTLTKADIVNCIDNKYSIDSIAIHLIEQSWNQYDVSHSYVYAGNNTYSSSHIYWYGQERTKAMNSSFTDPSRIMSQDLNQFNNIVLQDYSKSEILSAGIIENFRRENETLKSNYRRAGLSTDLVASYFWNEFHKEQSTFDTGELVSTLWDQTEPYNRFNTDRTDFPGLKQPLGCVTVAVAQIINYYTFPDNLVRKEGITRYTEYIDWSETQYPYLYQNDTNNKEIPKLLRFVNQGVHTVNGNTGSSSNITNAMDFLKLNGYSVQRKTGINTTEWINELKQFRPIYVRGRQTNESFGHAFICNGYREVSTPVELELKSTNSLAASDYSSNPYYTIKRLKGSSVHPSTMFFCFNLGWGQDYPNCWIVKPVSSIEVYGQNFEEIEYLLISL